jgi:hypothetical protein
MREMKRPLPSPRPPSLSTALALMLAGCAHAPSQVLDAQPWYGDLHALAREAAEVRETKLTQQFEVVPLDDAAFFAEYARINGDASAALKKEIESTLGEFTGLSTEQFGELAGQMRAQVTGVREEQLIAFYHFASHRMVLRQTIPPVLVEGGERIRFLSLAHEVGHVLQDQLGVGTQHPASFDESITLRAVLEGDATLTATLLDARRQGLTPKRAIERGRLSTQAFTTSQLLEVTGLSPKLLQASPIIRELFLFPYFTGQRFISDLYQAGGLPLVQLALLNPPRRSDFIYSPQRWLDGGTPRLEPLANPPRRLGLVILRSFIEHCSKKPVAGVNLVRWVEEHYLDDSFHREGSTLSWVTEWSNAATPRDLTEPKRTPSEATANNASLDSIAPQTLLECFGQKPNDITSAIDGEVVALVSGGPLMERERLASAAAKTAKQPSAPAQLGKHVPAPAMEVAFRPAGRGSSTTEQWTHEKLGLTMSIPGAKVLDAPGVALLAVAPDATLVLMFVDDAPNTKTNDGFTNALLDGFIKGMKLPPGGFPLSTKHVWTPTQLDWVSGTEARESFQQPTAIHTLVLNVCGGKASINVVMMGFKPGTIDRLDEWVATLRGSSLPPICSDP